MKEGPLKKSRMIASLMTEILNFKTIEEKKRSSRSLRYKKLHKRLNAWKGRIFE